MATAVASSGSDASEKAASQARAAACARSLVQDQVVVIKSGTKCLSAYGPPTETEPRAGFVAIEAASAGSPSTQFKVNLQKNGAVTLQSISLGFYLVGMEEQGRLRLGAANNNAVSTGRVPISDLSFLVIAADALQALNAGSGVPIVTDASADALLWLGPTLKRLERANQNTDAPLNFLDLPLSPTPVLDLESTAASSGVMPYPAIPLSTAGPSGIPSTDVRAVSEDQILRAGYFCPYLSQVFQDDFRATTDARDLINNSPMENTYRIHLRTNVPKKPVLDRVTYDVLGLEYRVTLADSTAKPLAAVINGLPMTLSADAEHVKSAAVGGGHQLNMEFVLDDMACPAIKVAYTQWNLAATGASGVKSEWKNLDGNVADSSTFRIEPADAHSEKLVDKDNTLHTVLTSKLPDKAAAARLSGSVKGLYSMRAGPRPLPYLGTVPTGEHVIPPAPFAANVLDALDTVPGGLPPRSASADAVRAGLLTAVDAVKNKSLSAGDAIANRLTTAGELVQSQAITLQQAISEKLLTPVAAIHTGLISGANAVKNNIISAKDAVDNGLVTAASLITDNAITLEQAINDSIITPVAAVRSGLIKASEAVRGYNGGHKILTMQEAFDNGLISANDLHNYTTDEVLQVMKPAAAVRLEYIGVNEIVQKARLSPEQAKALVLEGVVTAVEGVKAHLITADDAYAAKLLSAPDYDSLKDSTPTASLKSGITQLGGAIGDVASGIGSAAGSAVHSASINIPGIDIRTDSFHPWGDISDTAKDIYKKAIKEGKNVGQILSEDPTATVVDAVKAGVITAADAITADLKGATGILTVEKALAANLFPNAIAAVGLVPLGKLDLSAQSIKNLGLTVADFVDRGFATAAQLIKDFKSIDAKLAVDSGLITGAQIVLSGIAKDAEDAVKNKLLDAKHAVDTGLSSAKYLIKSGALSPLNDIESLKEALKDSVGVIATATAAIVNEIVPAIDAVKNDVLSARQAIDHALTTAKDLIVAGALKATTDIRDQIKKAIDDGLIKAVDIVTEGIMEVGAAIKDNVITPGVALGGQLVDLGKALEQGWLTAADQVSDAAKRASSSAAGLGQKVWEEAGKALERVDAVVFVPAANFLSAVVDGVVNGVNKTLHFVIQLADDAAQFAALVFKQVKGAIQAVIDFLKKIFAFGDYIATSDKLKDFIRSSLKGLSSNHGYIDYIAAQVKNEEQLVTKSVDNVTHTLEEALGITPSPPGSNDHPEASIAFTPPNVAADWLLDKLGDVIRNILPVQDFIGSLNAASAAAMDKAFDALKPITDTLDNIVQLLGPPIVSALLTGNLQHMIATIIELVPNKLKKSIHDMVVPLEQLTVTVSEAFSKLQEAVDEKLSSDNPLFIILCPLWFGVGKIFSSIGLKNVLPKLAFLDVMTLPLAIPLTLLLKEKGVWDAFKSYDFTDLSTGLITAPQVTGGTQIPAASKELNDQRRAMAIVRTMTDSFGGFIRTLAYNDPQQKLPQFNGRGMTMWTLIGTTYRVTSLSASSLMIADPRSTGSLIAEGLALSLEVVSRCTKSPKAPKERGISMTSLLCLTIGTAATLALDATGSSGGARLISLEGVKDSNKQQYQIAAWSYLALSFMPSTAVLLLDDGTMDPSRLYALIGCFAGIYAGQAAMGALIEESGPW